MVDSEKRPFDTPSVVARELAKHLPKNIERVLDPSVGAGALISPILSNLTKKNSKLVCVDNDPKAIEAIKMLLKHRPSLSKKLINKDFLTWSLTQPSSSFDCIVMNPPFAACKSKLHRLSYFDESGASISRYVPLEAAFLFQSLELLSDGGRILAVLPTSIVMSQSLQWLRSKLFDSGKIISVHELPPRTFPNVESRMYLMIFDKAKYKRKINLFNHDLRKPHKLSIEFDEIKLKSRLDFGYYNSLLQYEELIEKSGCHWRTLGEVASVIRGSIKSPIGSSSVIHTDSFSSGYWIPPSNGKKLRLIDNVNLASKNDILVKRVGRNSYQSFGRFDSSTSYPCSDCVFIIRPKPGVSQTSLLFALKVLSHISSTKSLLEKGTGASYISKQSLLELYIPMNLSERHKKTYLAYAASDKSKSTHWIKHTQHSKKLLINRTFTSDKF